MKKDTYTVMVFINNTQKIICTCNKCVSTEGNFLNYNSTLTLFKRLLSRRIPL